MQEILPALHWSRFLKVSNGQHPAIIIIVSGLNFIKTEDLEWQQQVLAEAVVMTELTGPFLELLLPERKTILQNGTELTGITGRSKNGKCKRQQLLMPKINININ